LRNKQPLFYFIITVAS